MKKYSIRLAFLHTISGTLFQQSLLKSLSFGILSGLVICSGLNAQETDVPYVPTPENVVEKMLDVVNAGPGDYLIDLGSGDGRIVIAAAKRGAVGHGVDIDPVRIKEANENAKMQGVEGKVIFVQENIFETDFSKADVVTMYLFNSVNMILRPSLLEKLRPGTRVVSHSFDMNSWKPDKHIKEGNRDIYYWVIPAHISGNWDWKIGESNFKMEVNQEFQQIELQIHSGDVLLEVQNPKLSGDKIYFEVFDKSNGTGYLHSGHVDGNQITGTVQIRNRKKISTVKNWTARKKAL
jgi:SAM-dependent methyltransferase